MVETPVRPSRPSSSKAQASPISVGRRKESVARVRLREGSGVIKINGRTFEDYFPRESMRISIHAPLLLTQQLGKYDVIANVNGGGLTGQAGAVSRGVARALLIDNGNFDKILRENGLLTRDSREVERKKYGRHKARRSTQFSKR